MLSFVGQRCAFIQRLGGTLGILAVFEEPVVLLSAAMHLMQQAILISCELSWCHSRQVMTLRAHVYELHQQQHSTLNHMYHWWQ